MLKKKFDLLILDDMMSLSILNFFETAIHQIII